MIKQPYKFMIIPTQKAILKKRELSCLNFFPVGDFFEMVVSCYV